MRRKLVALAVSAASVLAVAGGATAAVTFNASTGTGFVGKGDVQLALGLNNAQLQQQAGGLSFTYADVAEYEVPCLKDNGRQILRNSFNRSRSLDASVTYDSRQRNQVTGFNLTGFGGSPTVDGNIACPGGWEPDGDPVLVAASGGALRVNGVNL